MGRGCLSCYEVSMKVAFNARLLVAPTLRGWNRYTINLLAQLPALGVKLFLYSDQPIHEDHLARLPSGSYHVRVQPMLYAKWEQSWLPRQCDRDGVDLLHCPLNFGLPWRSRCPRILTLHDAIDSVYYGRRMSWRAALRPASLRSRVHHWIARRRADHIITVSEHAKGDLIQHLGLPEEKITAIYEAADPVFLQPATSAARADVRRRYGLAQHYFFYVGGWEQRKNVPFLLHGFAAAALPEAELVLAGGHDEQRAALMELAGSLGIGNRLRLLGWVEDADLPALYGEALAFVYPSEYEGFGLQVCEAMAAGCPVLAAAATSLPEIVGNGGKTFTLQETGELARMLRQLSQDEACRDEMRQLGRGRSLQFSWERTAQQTLDVYECVLGRSDSGRVRRPHQPGREPSSLPLREGCAQEA